MKGARIALCSFVFILALGLTLYPLVSNWLAERYQSSALSNYTDTVAGLDDLTLAAERQKADAYNARIAERAVPLDGPNASLALNAPEVGYEETLSLYEGGIMGYIRIPAIDIVLPIFHGVEGDVLEQGVGHMPGSSVPVGGVNTHAVLAAHSGLASQRMFTDLEKMQLGDMFFISVLGETLAYEVDDINIVEPDDASRLGLVENGDYITLLTCTPYAINTHRLLVRGRRVPFAPEEAESVSVEAQTPSTWREQYVFGLSLGLCLLLGVVVIPLILWQIYRLYHPRRRYKHER